jgi:hypothetical protein
VFFRGGYAMDRKAELINRINSLTPEQLKKAITLFEAQKETPKK